MNWKKILTIDGRLNVHNVSSGIVALLVIIYWYVYTSNQDSPGFYLILPFLFIFSIITYSAYTDTSEKFEVIGEIVIMNVFYLPYRFIKEKNWEVTGRTLLLNGTSLFILTTIWLNQLNIEIGLIAETLFKGFAVFLFLTVTIFSRQTTLKDNYSDEQNEQNERTKEEKKDGYSVSDGEY